MLFDPLLFLTLEFYAVFFCCCFCFVLVGFICFCVLSCLGDLYLVLKLKFCFVLLLTRIKSKDITYTSGINEDVVTDFGAQSCAVSLSTGWPPGHGKPGAGGELIAGCGLSEGAAPKGLAWGGQSWVLVTGSSTASGVAKHDQGMPGAAVG